MAVVKITDAADLENFSEVLDRFADDLVNNRGWTDRRDEVDIGLDECERFIERPAVDTVNGEAIIIGMRKNDVGGDIAGRDRQAELVGSRSDTWALAAEPLSITDITQATSAVITVGTHTYTTTDLIYVFGVSGMTEINGLTGSVTAITATTITVSINTSAFTAYGSGGTTELGFVSMRGHAVAQENGLGFGFCAINLLDDTPYVTAWFLTPDDTGATPTDHQYAYCILEVSVGVYRAFGFGEGIKLGTWDGGVFVLGNWMDPLGGAQSAAHIGFCTSGSQEASGFFGAATQNIVSLKENLFGIVFTSSVGASTNNNGWMNAGYVVETGNQLPGRSGFFAPSWLMVGGSVLQGSPSAFSGQAYRTPVRYWVHTAADDNEGNVAPMLEIPDVFACNLRDFNPGDTVLDDTDEFLVVPTLSKQSITPNSGNAGFLILNNGLIP